MTDDESSGKYNILKIGTPATGGEVRIVLDPLWSDEQIRDEIVRWLNHSKFAFDVRKEMGFPESSRAK